MKFENRQYQIDAVKKAFQWIKEGNRRFVMQAPTGAGKTWLAARITLQAVRQGIPVIIAAHRIELLRQAREKLEESGLSGTAIRTYGKESEGPIDALVHLGSVASLLKRAPRNARLIIVDEAHRSASPTYMRLFDMFPDAVICGLSATPERLDGRPLDIYNDILVVAQPSEMIARGYIVEPSTWSSDPLITPDLSGLPKSMGDFSMSAASKALNTPQLVGNIVEHWKNHAEGLPTICFASSVQHSKDIAQAFLDAGIAAEHIDGKSGDTLRFDARDRLVSGEVSVVCNFGLWVEGVDIPEAKCCILARPTQSLTVYLQAIGRVCRPFGGIKPVVLDHAGNWERFGSMKLDRVYSISGRAKRPSSDVPAPWICPMCLFGNDSTDLQCMNPIGCGCDKPKRAAKRKVRTVEGELVEVTFVDTPEVKREYWDQLWRRAWNIGELPQWVVERYRKRFGEDPGADWRPPVRKHIPKVDPKELWKEAGRYRSITYKMKLSRPMAWSWVRQKLQSKYGVEFPVDMDPEMYAMSLNEDEMTRRRETTTGWYLKQGLSVPAAIPYGASTMIPYDGIADHFESGSQPVVPATAGDIVKTIAARAEAEKAKFAEDGEV